MEHEWYIVFGNEASSIFDWMLPKKNQYRHIALFFKRELGWYMIAPCNDYWRFEELMVMASQDLSKHIFLMPHYIHWVKVKVFSPNRKGSLLMIPTCIEVVKRITGITIGHCLTCYGLYKQLRKFDGKTNFKIIDEAKRDNV